MKKMGVKGEPYPSRSNASVTTFERDNGRHVSCIICYPGFEANTDPIIAFGMIAHEALHVIDKCVIEMGEQSQAEEFRAYGIQFIVQTALEILMDYHGRKLKWS